VKFRFYSFILLLGLGFGFHAGCRSLPLASHTPSVPRPILLAQASEEDPLHESLPSYFLGTGDVLDIRVLYQPDYDRSVKIPPNEAFSFPNTPLLNTRGKTVVQIEKEIQNHLEEYLVRPEVSVNLLEYSPQKVVILGKVKNPGLYPHHSGMTLAEAIAFAGGIQKEARAKSILLIPKNKSKPELLAFTEKNPQAAWVSLNAGDMVIIPAKTISNVNDFIELFFTGTNPILRYYLDILDIENYKELIRRRG